MKLGVMIPLMGVLLAGCTVDPVKDNGQAIKAAQAKGLPIVIYRRRANDQLDFINVSSHPIKEVDLRLASCGNGAVAAAYAATRQMIKEGILVTVKGDFEPGYAYKVRHAQVAPFIGDRKATYPFEEWLSRRAWIFAIRVRYKDGTPEVVYNKADIPKLITSRVNNNCSVDSQGMPADMQFLRS